MTRPGLKWNRRLTGVFSDEEVEGYYQEGMPIPDDVTLLWTDDT